MRSLAALAAALVAGCTLDGHISPALPDDLELVGTPLVGDPFAAGPAITAVGGTSSITVESPDATMLLPGGVPTFDADDDGGAAVAIDRTDLNVVHVRGVAAGQNDLRLTDPADGTLYVHIPMHAAVIAHVQPVEPTGFEYGAAGADLAFLTGPHVVGLGLFDEIGFRLADDSLRIAATTPADIQQTDWDVLATNVTTPAVRTVELTAGSAARTVDIAFVDTLDDIAGDGAVPLVRPGPTSLCVEGLNAGRHVVGIADWTISGDGVTDAGPAKLGCVDFTLAAKPGPATLHVSGAGFAKDLDVTVVP